MIERVAVPRSTRFEVFKRDKFTCQYCGAKAPDVLLECDHIHPVAEGGTNEILNLVTACQSCNGGKGARRLDDSSVVQKQRAQIDLLEERRAQLEMLIDWRDQLDRPQLDHVDAIIRRIEQKTQGDYRVNESGRDSVRRWLKKYGIEEVLVAIDDAFDIYLKFNGDLVDEDSWERAFGKIGWSIWTNRQMVEKPYIRRLLYIQGILRNRLRDPRGKYLNALESMHVAGIPLDWLEDQAKLADSWKDFDALAVRWEETHNPGDESDGT